MRIAAAGVVLFLTLITAASAQAPAVRVFITDNLTSKAIAEWSFSTFADRNECQGLTITSRPWRAHFTITARRDQGEGVVEFSLGGANWVAVFDGWGDMLYEGSTRQFGNSMKDACEAIDREIEGGAELITVGEADPVLVTAREVGGR